MCRSTATNACRGGSGCPSCARPLLCTGIAAATASLLVWLAPPSGDLAAHEYQRSLFLVHGFTLWDNFWYAGRYAFVGYSVLYYPLAALLGIRLLAVLTVALAAGAFARAARAGVGTRGALGGPLVRGRLGRRADHRRVPVRARHRRSLCSALLALQRRAALARAPALTLLVLAASPVALVLLAVVLVGSCRRAPRSPTARARRAGARASACGGGRDRPAASLSGRRPARLPRRARPSAASTFCIVGIALTSGHRTRTRAARSASPPTAIASRSSTSIPSGLGENVARLRYPRPPARAARRSRSAAGARCRSSMAAVALAAARGTSPRSPRGWARSASDRSARARRSGRPPVALPPAHLRPGLPRRGGRHESDHWPALLPRPARDPAGTRLVPAGRLSRSTRLLYRQRPLHAARSTRPGSGASAWRTSSSHDAPPDYSSRREARLITERPERT